MNKGEFIKAIAEKTEMTAKDVETLVKGYIEVVTETLKAGEKIQLPGFGNYEIKTKPAKEMMNPLTKKMMHVEEKRVPAFKMGKAYKDLFN